MLYKQTKFYENCEKRIFDGVGKYDIPYIEGTPYISDIADFIGWNEARSCKNPEGKAVHFFIDDYQFTGLWNQPDKYLDLLSKYEYVLSPDFSPYADFPKAVQIFNHHRKHWIGAYLQENGIKVIPTITWSYPPSYDFCFDGEPKNSVVAVSSVGCMRSVELKKMFMDGWREMMKRLSPTEVIFYGTIPKECDGNITRIEPFHKKFDEFRKVLCDG